MLNADIDDVHSEETLTDEDGNDITLPGYVRLFGKGSKERLVPLGNYAHKAIQDYLVRGRPALVAHGKGTAALFVNGRGGRLGRQGAWLILKEAAEAAGLSADFSPHCCRAAPIFAWCRSCWGTPPSRPRRCTPRSLPRGSWRFTGWRIRVPTNGDKTPPIRGTAALEVTL